MISPALAQLAALPTPLTPGEKQVLEFFTRHLPEAWEIYIQPHLNGLRPDFVLLHPENGIAVYEVKDWNLSAMDYFFEGNPRLYGPPEAAKPFLSRLKIQSRKYGTTKTKFTISTVHHCLTERVSG